MLHWVGQGRKGLLCAAAALLSYTCLCAPAIPRVPANNVRDVQKKSSVPEWHAMGNTPCAWEDPLVKPDGSLDAERTIQALQRAGFTCNVFVISGARGNSYESFQKLLDAGEKAKIVTWAVLIPPSEGASSLPYRSDYVAWMKELGRLSRKYEHFRGVNIDDLDQDESQATFTRDYVCKIRHAAREENPRLQFVPTVYDLDKPTADRLAGCVDGVWLWWVNLEKATGLRSFLENSRLAAAGRFPIYGGVYAHWTSWHKNVNPAPKIFQETLEEAYRHSDGVVIWRLSLDPSDPLLSQTRQFSIKLSRKDHSKEDGEK